MHNQSNHHDILSWLFFDLNSQIYFFSLDRFPNVNDEHGWIRASPRESLFINNILYIIKIIFRFRK